MHLTQSGYIEMNWMGSRAQSDVNAEEIEGKTQRYNWKASI